MQVRLDKSGRVVVPKQVRESLGLAPGATLELEEEGGRVSLRPLRDEAPLVERDGVLVFCGAPKGPLEGALKRSRQRRARRLSKQRKQMAVLFDTSVLVAAMVEGHSAHGRCRPWLARAKAGELAAHVNGHTLMELYAVLTTLPVRPRISAQTARRMIRDNVEEACQVVVLSRTDQTVVGDRMAALGLSGGVIYDALAARAAEKLGVEALLTLNPGDRATLRWRSCRASTAAAGSATASPASGSSPSTSCSPSSATPSRITWS